MKKTIIISLLVVAIVASMALVFAACDTTAEFNADGDFKIGAIYINSQNDTSGYTYAHHSAITKAMEELEIEKSKLVIVDNVAEEYNAVSTAVDNLVGKGCDLIIGISFGYIDAMADKAKEYPNVIFSHATGYMSNDTNFNNYFGRIYQARYLAGIAAGLKSLQIENNNIGYVSAYTTSYAETASGINAFAMGAIAANPNAKVYVKTLGSWGNETQERALAEALINTKYSDNKGCGVISQHCDSAQPQLAAEAADVFGCGYNSDMTAQAPNAHLTATIWHWDVYYKAAIEAAMEGPANFMEKMGKDYYTGLKEGLVGVSPITKNCAPNTQAAIDNVTKLIIEGKWDVFSGVKLSIAADGSVTMNDAALVDCKGNVIVEAGGASVDDSVIKSTMNYLVEGVVGEYDPA